MNAPTIDKYQPLQLFTLKKEWRVLPQHQLLGTNRSEEDLEDDDEDPDIAKIKKVQSFFRGWLCRLAIQSTSVE